MACFSTEYSGGPSDGRIETSDRPPRIGDTRVVTTPSGVHHSYVFKCAGWLPPAWRHAGVIMTPARQS